MPTKTRLQIRHHITPDERIENSRRNGAKGGRPVTTGGDGRAKTKTHRFRSRPYSEAMRLRIIDVLSMCDYLNGLRLPNLDVRDGIVRHMHEPKSISDASISRILGGRTELTIEHVRAFCKWVKLEWRVSVDPGWLTFGDLSDATGFVLPTDVERRPDPKIEAELARAAKLRRQAKKRA